MCVCVLRGGGIHTFLQYKNSLLVIFRCRYKVIGSLWGRGTHRSPYHKSISNIYHVIVQHVLFSYLYHLLYWVSSDRRKIQYIHNKGPVHPPSILLTVSP